MCRNCNIAYKRKDHFEVHLRKSKGEPKRKTLTQKRALGIPDEMFMLTMLSANEMLDFSYDNPIRDMDVPSQEKTVEPLYEQKTSLYIVDDFFDLLAVADEA